MSRPVKLTVSIYLVIVSVLTCSYLILILIGSIQGNDMKNSVLDTDNSKRVENVDHINNTSKQTTETNSVPSDSQSSLIKQISSFNSIQSHTRSLDNPSSENLV
ncbi:hypothetical protein [Staphylococcus casei]|uniref:Uncharacterized protein n=1 Tax=Staphylococcus casei TaxID=201828 RepID=A0ABZ2W8M2_9STAP|nr:hypothetical protein AST12_02410 [Staphylococcus succinus]PTI42299.1 hypothetical protein BU056_01875 [Staphylococcus succinus]